MVHAGANPQVLGNERVSHLNPRLAYTMHFETKPMSDWKCSIKLELYLLLHGYLLLATECTSYTAIIPKDFGKIDNIRSNIPITKIIKNVLHSEE